jgi:hypothetical protein
MLGQLPLDQSRVDSLAFEELGVAALLDQLSVLDY